MVSMIASRNMGAFDHIGENSAPALTQIRRARRLRTQLREDGARDAATGVIATTIIHEFCDMAIGHLAEENYKKTLGTNTLNPYRIGRSFALRPLQPANAPPIRTAKMIRPMISGESLTGSDCQ
jgi:hypothetical protein